MTLPTPPEPKKLKERMKRELEEKGHISAESMVELAQYLWRGKEKK